jgi:hypothetical protein
MSPDPTDRAALGVLFVHGIGSQTRGLTLTECAGELVDWWRAWLPHLGGAVQVERTVLALEPARYQPAHSVVRLDSATGPNRVVLAESWWAADFPPPAFSELATWMLTFGSWIVISHMLAFWQAWAARVFPRPKWLRGMVSSAAAVLGLAVAAGALFLVQILLLVLGLLAVLPVPSIRRWVTGVVLGLESLIGDSFAFSGNPIANSAVTSRVRLDLDWLAERCDSIVVVAHSQGAAIAVRALEHYLVQVRSEHAWRVHRLITYGSGLVKLTQLEDLTRPPRGYPGIIRYLWIIIAVVAVALPFVARETYLSTARIWTALRTAPGSIWFDPASFQQPMSFTPFLLLSGLMAGTGLVVWVAVVARRRFERARAQVREVAERLCWHLDWTDLYASSDPVPNGPLFSEAPPPRFTGREVTNARNFARDHVTYWRNVDEFVGHVAREIDTVAGVASVPDDVTFDAAVARRQRRVGWLVWLRRVTVAAALVSVLSQANWFTVLGATHVVPPLAAILPAFVSQIGSALAASPSPILRAIATAVCFMLGAATLGGLAWLCFRVPREVWDYWDRTEVRRLLSGDPQSDVPRRWAMASFAVFLVFIGWMSVRATVWGYPRAGDDVLWVWEQAQAGYAWMARPGPLDLWVWRAAVVAVVAGVLSIVIAVTVRVLKALAGLAATRWRAP